MPEQVNAFRNNRTKIMDQFDRTRRLLGDEAMERLKTSRVAVFGLGGVGGHAAEALIRAGIGAIDIVDKDRVDITNLNRQAVAFHSTVGKYKTDVMKERLLDINPDAAVRTYCCFFLPGEEGRFPFADYDYVLDAVDTVTAKIALIEACNAAGTPVISSMGAGNKLHPELFEIADIYDTSVCPLAKVMRRELKKRGIRSLKCVYSKEVPVQPAESEQDPSRRKAVPASVSFVPSAAGLIMAGEVVRDLLSYCS